MRKTYAFKAKLSKTTKAKALEWLSLCQKVYNICIEQRRFIWEQRKKSISAYSQSNQLPELKKEFPEFKNVEIGAHLHTTPDTWEEKVNAAYSNGCKRFDGAIKGFGGCPMAKDDLTGNMATENIITYLNENKIETGLNLHEFKNSLTKAIEVFPS